MKKPKCYVVWHGRKPGIYMNWADCLEQVDKFEGAFYKGFDDLEEAKTALVGDYKKYIYNKKKSTAQDHNNDTGLAPEWVSVSVDAAWNTVTGIMEYRGVDTSTKKQLFIQGPFRDATNNIGEFLAIVHALALLKQQNSMLPIYSDSMTAIKWVRDRHAKTKLVPTPENILLFDLISRAEQWLKANTYPNRVLKWRTDIWGEIPADFGRK